MDRKGSLIFIALTLVSGSLLADTLKIIGIPGAPYRYYNEDNQLVGFDVDILDEIMTQLGVDYHVELINSSTRLTKLWQDPDIDMVFTLSKKPQRLSLLTYADEPHLNLSWNFFIRKENLGRVSYQSYADLTGLVVGATQGFAYTPGFWQAAEEGVFTLDTVVNNNLNLKKLVHGRFDIFPSNTTETLFQAKREGYLDEIAYLKKPLKQTPYYNSFVKASNYAGLADIMSGYNKELKAMKQDGRYQTIYQAYFGPSMESENVRQ